MSAASRRPGARGRVIALGSAGVIIAMVAWIFFGRNSSPRLAPGTNLVVITLDTVRADRLTPYGFKGIETPALEQLARDGVLFEHAYTTAPLTFPAHASLFTGLTPPATGVRDNSGFRLRDDVPTMAELFKRLQYRTAAFVSAFVLDGRGGLNRGFDRYRDEFGVRQEDLAAMARIQRSGEDTWAAAKDWLAGSSSTPFFLWLHFYDAHTPYDAPEPFRSRYPTLPYEAEIAHVDSLVGQVLSELERLGVADRTLIVVVGDHGEGLGEHGEDEHGMLLYDSTLHVPLIIRFPDHRRAGVRVQRAVSLVDVLPSIAELFSQQLARPVDGHSLIDAVAAPAAMDGPPLFAETEYPRLQFGWSALQSVRNGRLKYTRAPTPELYEYRTDPGEARNLAGRLGEDVTRLDAAVTTMTAGHGVASPATVDGGTVAALRTLGYVAGGGDAAADTNPTIDPKDKIEVYRRLMSARAALDGGDNAAGVRMLEALLDTEPEFEAVHRSYRDYFLGEKRAADLIARLRPRLARRPGDVSLLRDLAEAQRSAGEPRAALATLDAALKVKGDSLAVLTLAGDILAEQGRNDEARVRYEQAIALNRQSSDLAMKLAKAHVQLGQLDASDRLIDSALADHTDVSGAHYLRAVIAEQRGNLLRAEAEYRQELALHAWDYQARFNLARLLGGRGVLDEEITLLDSIPALAPGFGAVHFYRAKAYLDAGDAGHRQAAIDAAHLGLRMAPDDPSAPLGHYVLADIYRLEGRPAEGDRELALGHALETRLAQH